MLLVLRSKLNCRMFKFPKNRSNNFPSYSHPVLPLTVVWACRKWKKMTQNSNCLSARWVCVCFRGFLTMPGAGGRDLADEIQVRQSQITPSPDLAGRFQHTANRWEDAGRSIEGNKRQETDSFKKVNCIIFVASGYNRDTKTIICTWVKIKTVKSSQ